MTRTASELTEAAKLCRGMAATCATDEAREALLEVADSLEEEAGGMFVEPPSDRSAPMFNWTR